MKPMDALVLSFMAASVLRAADPEMRVHGKVARIDFRLDVNASPQTLLAAVFDAKNLVLLSRADRVELVRQEPMRQIVRYTYRAMLMENQSVYERLLLPAAGTLMLTMKENTRSSTWLPEQASSHGFYRVTPRAEGATIEYHQETLFGRDLGFFERRYMEASGKEQIAKMKAFLQAVR